MDQFKKNHDSDSPSLPSLESEISSALEGLLSQFNDRKKGIRILSKKIDIHEKTLVRILNNENKPSYQTVFKIFRVTLNEYNDVKVLNLVPSLVREFLIKNNAQELIQEKNYSTLSDLELQKNPIMSEIYIIAATGPVTFDQIESRFGRYGIDLLSKMLEKNLLIEAHKNVFIPGNNAPVFTGETIISIGSAMISSHAKTTAGEEMDKNFVSFYAEGLSPEAYAQWLAIDQEAYKRKFELTRDPNKLGSIRAFTFMISETIELQNLH